MSIELKTTAEIQARLSLYYEEAQQRNSLSILMEIARLLKELDLLAEHEEIIY